jgi:FkbM family methyltransferase
MPPGSVNLRCPPAKLHVFKNPWRLYREIFLDECYEPLVPLGRQPRILDIGANIGLASLFFLARWPAARLTAWEPNPAAFRLLEKNLVPEEHEEAEIEIEARALSTSGGPVEFLVPRKDPTAVYAGMPRPEAEPDPTSERLEVQSVSAASLFSEPADLLKLDIEGQEYPVLEEALPEASRIRSLAIEFHRVERTRRRLEAIVARLTSDGGYRGVGPDGKALALESLGRFRGSLVLRFVRRNA